jgi:hypothetical protein
VGTFLTVMYLAGAVGAVMVGRARAEISQIGRLRLMTAVLSPVWFARQMASVLLWPLFLVVWLIQGRPGPEWIADGSQGVLRVRRRTAQEMR